MIRYEGRASTSGSPGFPNIVAEIIFYNPAIMNNNNVAEIRLGVHNKPNALFGIASSSSWYSTSTITPNTSYVIDGSTNGTSFTIYKDRNVLLPFDCSQNETYLLGNCNCEYSMKLLYEGAGCTSNTEVKMLGDSIIDSSGSGPLVLTSNITHDGACERTLTLAGSNADNNELSGVIQNGGSGTSVLKTGPGLWRLTGNSSYSGRLTVSDGTLVVGVPVASTSFSPFGMATDSNLLPIIGSSTANLTGTAALLADDVSISRGFSVAALGSGSSQVVVIGNAGSSTATFAAIASIRLGRDVTLSASTGSEVIFASAWKDSGGFNNPEVAFDIGRAENLGTVVLKAFLPESITIVDVYPGATAKLDGGDDTIYHETPVVLGLGSTLDLNGTDQPLDSLTLKASNTTVTGGTLTLNSSLVEVDGTGGGHDIESDVNLAGSATFDVTNPASLTVSGIIGGTGGVVKTGSGTLTLEGDITYTGQTSITGGTLVVEKEFSNSSDISLVRFTSTTLEITFTTIPTSGATYKLLGGSTSQTYDTEAITLLGASGVIATYNSLTSTLTIS